MKKQNKKNLLYILISIIVFLSIIIVIHPSNSLFATRSFLNEEVSIIEYLRTLYYSSFDLLPDFAFNIGNGQNVFYLVDYGLVSPITLISYLLPFLDIKLYLIIIVIITQILSIILAYKFFIRKKYKSEVCLLTTIIFTTSSSLILSTYNNPLLTFHILLQIISLYGVDKVYDNKKSYLLIISTFLMLLNNIYFSISGIITILLYGLYRYLNHMNTITIKTLIKRLSSIILPIIVAILCSSFILVPTIVSQINIINKQVPTILNNILYTKQSIYSLGITFILIPSIINYIRKDKTNIIISIFLILILILSIVKNIPLILFLPLYLLIILEFLKDTINKKVFNKKIIIATLLIYIALIIVLENAITITIELLILIVSFILYYKTSKTILLITPITIFMLINTIVINNNIYISSSLYNYENTIIKNALNYINKQDNNIYRTHINLNNYQNINYKNINYNSSSININYSNNLYEEFNKNILIDNNNYESIFSLILHNNKYIITNEQPLQGYQLLSKYKNIYIYESQNTLPIGYASTEIMSYEDFSKLDKYTKQEALLNVVVADTSSDNSFVPNTKSIDLPLEEVFKSENISINKDNIIVNAKENIQLNYELPDKYKNKIIFISMNVNTSRDNQILKINNITKELEKNNSLDYILASQNQNKLVFTFTKGQYNITNLKFYILDYATIEKVNQKIYPFIIDELNTKGDHIIGSIENDENSYFTITIPYERGFKIKVDNNYIKYEKVNETYIGFPLEKGYHSIEITYIVPGKLFGYLLSILGITSFITVAVFESKRQFY